MIGLARFGAHRLRELALYPAMARRKSGRTVLFLPCLGREMSGLLRGYDVADALNTRGWCAVVLPKQLEPVQRQRVLRRLNPDISVLMTSRNQTNSHELLQGRRYVYDIDDADFHDPVMAERMERDIVASTGVIAGSRYVARWCEQFQPNTRVVWTGAKPHPGTFPDHQERGPLVVWAQSQPERYTGEFDMVVAIMERVAARRSGVRLRLYGDGEARDGGRSARLRQAGVTVEWLPFLDYGAYVASLGQAAVGLSPICTETPFSRGKSFGKILAYLDARVPVVTSDAVDHALLFEPGSGVVSNDPDIWVESIERLLDSPQERDDMAARAHEIYRRRLSVDAATDRVEAFLLDCIARPVPETVPEMRPETQNGARISPDAMSA
ncbi:MAG: glycosyltransferase [Tropicimonas sp.]|uniref:glycosyltransferase family protein n=1 Tax=Tropicimonas sp. TaxID=2067044 RepID=UPI003A8A84A3